MSSSSSSSPPPPPLPPPPPATAGVASFPAAPSAVPVSAGAGAAAPRAAAAVTATAAAAATAAAPASPWRQFLLDQHLPLGLVVFSLLGFTFPAPGRALAATPLNSVSLIGIFFLSGLGLRTDELRAAFAAVPAYAFGFASILAISPCLGFALAGPAFDFLGPPEFKRGLAIFFIMPTTVSSGQVMTVEAGGNAALAVLFSVVTNLVGIVTVPLFLSAIVAQSGGGGSGGGGGGGGDAGSPPPSAGINAGALIFNLSLVILLPLALGKALREGSKRARDFAAARKVPLKVLSSALLISVPWMSMSAASGDIGRAAPANIFALAVLGVLLHALLLAFNFGACELLALCGVRIALRERKAVVVNCSQKTLNTAVSVIAFLPAALGDRGLITVPCIIAHLAQILMDGVLVARWKHVTEDAAAAAAPPAAGAGAAAKAQEAPLQLQAAPVSAAVAVAAATAGVEEWAATGLVPGGGGAGGAGDLREVAAR